MKQEIFSCDVCKKKVDSREDLYHIRVEIAKCLGGRTMHYGNYDICIPCAVRVGFIRQTIQNNEIKTEPKDVKDRLFDIVAEIVSEIIQE